MTLRHPPQIVLDVFGKHLELRTMSERQHDRTPQFPHPSDVFFDNSKDVRSPVQYSEPLRFNSEAVRTTRSVFRTPSIVPTRLHDRSLVPPSQQTFMRTVYLQVRIGSPKSERLPLQLRRRSQLPFGVRNTHRLCRHSHTIDPLPRICVPFG